MSEGTTTGGGSGDNQEREVKAGGPSEIGGAVPGSTLAATNGPIRIEDGAQGWEATPDPILRRELVAILRELGRRRYGESMRSSGGWSILTVPLEWKLPTADYPYTETRINVDEARMRIIANLTMVSADLGPNDVYCLIEWLGAIYASGAWPMERPAWPVTGGSCG